MKTCECKCPRCDDRYEEKHCVGDAEGGCCYFFDLPPPQEDTPSLPEWGESGHNNYEITHS